MNQFVTFRKRVYISQNQFWQFLQIFGKDINDLHNTFSVFSKQVLTFFKLLITYNIIHGGRNVWQHFGIFFIYAIKCVLY